MAKRHPSKKKKTDHFHRLDSGCEQRRDAGAWQVDSLEKRRSKTFHWREGRVGKPDVLSENRRRIETGVKDLKRFFEGGKHRPQEAGAGRKNELGEIGGLDQNSVRQGDKDVNKGLGLDQRYHGKGEKEASGASTDRNAPVLDRARQPYEKAWRSKRGSTRPKKKPTMGLGKMCR